MGDSCKSFMLAHPFGAAVIMAALLTLAVLAVLYVVSRRKRRQARRENSDLHDALDVSQQASAAKGNFMSRMSHEIRTPLNAIIGYTSIAKNELEQAKTEEERRFADMRIMDCLTKSEMASRHLLAVINDVLDMSAIESGKVVIAHERFDLKSVVGSLTVLFFSEARTKGVRFEVLLGEPTEEWFIGDQMRLNQILTNLLSNAVKFTPEGGRATLSVSQRVVDDKTTRVCFQVSDTGIGMTPAVLEHIWRPFEQGEGTIRRRYGGSGLGLSITKNLVELLGGEIRVESSPGAGTTFTVELPLERMPQPTKSDEFSFSDVNALVIDDDASTCDYIKLLFDRCGARCLTVTSGRDALTAFALARESGSPFNVCLVDWHMPRMDGIETVRRIREMAGEALPIIVVTAYDYAEITETATQEGVSMFVSKPLFQSSLFDLLANIRGLKAPPALRKSKRFDFAGARVLLTEDNKMNMEVARRILESARLTVDSAWNGQEALRLFTQAPAGHYSAILMDVHMPEMDGHEATRAIRSSQHPDAGSVPIIAMTADAFAENITEAFDAGMNDHIAKPIDIQTLFVVLSKYIPNAQ